MKQTSNKKYWEELKEHKREYTTQEQFPAFPNPYVSRMQPILHTGYLMFIRNKFLYLALLDSLESRNLYAAWSLLKSYWENVATFAYYYIEISELFEKGEMETAFEISRKMALGGRKFLTKKMVKNIGRTPDDFYLPSISTMLNKTDEDWEKSMGKSLGFKELYDTQIAEGGHTTFMGLSISGKWLPDRSLLPKVKKSWTKDDNKAILNLTSMSSLVFFYYWNKYLKINPDVKQD
jgi:hypothetical protein